MWRLKGERPDSATPEDFLAQAWARWEALRLEAVVAALAQGVDPRLVDTLMGAAGT